MENNCSLKKCADCHGCDYDDDFDDDVSNISLNKLTKEEQEEFDATSWFNAPDDFNIPVKGE